MRALKDSGIEWIGEIPKEWEIKKLKYISEFKQNKYNETDGNLTYIGLENIVAWNGQYIETASEYDKEQSLICDPNDILFGKLRPYLAKVYMNSRKQCCSGEFCVISVKEQNTRFMWYQLISHGFIFMVDRSTYGTKMPRANTDYIKNMAVSIPSLKEQKEIADFLDRKCAEIDTVTEKTKATIEEYKKLKQSVITEAVTKGIRGNRPMKDSGIEWIGKIPEDWDCCKLKYIIDTVNSGIGLSNKNLSDNGTYPVYGGGNLIGYYDDYNLENTLIIGRVGARCGCVTKIYGKAWATDNALIVKTTHNIDWLFYVLTALNLNKLNTSNAQPLITGGKVLNSSIAICSDETKCDIVKYLNAKCSEIDKLITDKTHLLEEMENYKKSVIYEYVTGKKEVV